MTSDRDRAHRGGAHRDRDRIVPLSQFTNRFEAETVAAMLESEGIPVTLIGAENAYTAVEISSGFRLDVFESDLERATQLLDTDEDPTPA